MSTSPDPVGAPAAWVFTLAPDEIDLPDAFSGGEAVLAFEIAASRVDAVRPGQTAHLWIEDRPHDTVPVGIYATGSIVGPVSWIEADDGAPCPVVEVGLDPLADPIDGLVLLAGDEFVGSPLHGASPGGAPENPVPLDDSQASAVMANRLEPGPLSAALAVGHVVEDDGIVLPALEVRLPADTLLVVDAEAHEGWTVVRATPDMVDVEELPDRHRTFMDAVEYVASVAEQAAGSLPVVDLDDGIEAVAIFDAEGGVYVVVKEGPAAYSFCWVDDDGTLERVDAYASLKEAILLPVLDEELFGEH